MNTMPVVGYEGFYEVSDSGKIFRVASGKGCIAGKEIKPSSNSAGYPVVSLCKNNKPRIFKVHRIVANAFLSNPQNYEGINHKDGNKQNNSVLNLEWCSCSKNNAHAHRIGLNQSMLLPKRAIIGTHIETGKMIEYYSIGEARRNGFHDSSISACCKGIRNKHMGYKWSYAGKNLLGHVSNTRNEARTDAEKFTEADRLERAA